MEDGEWHRHLKRMRLVYKRKMQLLVSALRDAFGHHLSIIGEQSGLYVLVKVHLNHSEEWLIERAFSHGVKVYPTSRYVVHNYPDKPMIKLGFSSLSFDEIQLGIELLKKAWL
jgi:GntR family transcriptional regulator/MocR family aminotransferase